MVTGPKMYLFWGTWYLVSAPDYGEALLALLPISNTKACACAVVSTGSAFSPADNIVPTHGGGTASGLSLLYGLAKSPGRAPTVEVKKT